MELNTQIDKVKYARQRGIGFIAPSDAQGIFAAAYGDSDNWPLPSEEAAGHYPIDTVLKAIKAVQRNAQEQAARLESFNELDDEGETEVEPSGGQRIEVSNLPESAKNSLMDSGFYTFDQIEQYLDDGGDLRDFNRIGESTANRIRQMMSGSKPEPEPTA